MSSKRKHTKSRLGCRQCKSRRVKCDERTPCCGCCAKRGVECEYQAWKPATESVQLITLSNFVPKLMPSTRHGYTLNDLALMHYFTVYTSQTVDPIGSAEYRQIWQRDVPRLAQDHDFLMRALLAFAAAHRATREDTEPIEDLRTSRHYYGEALTLFRDSVMDVNADKADAFFCYSILISFLTRFLEFQIPVNKKDPIANFIGFVHILQSSMDVLRPVQNTFHMSKIGNLLSHTITSSRQSSQRRSPRNNIHADVASSLNGLAHLMHSKGNKDTSARSNKLTIFTHALAQLREMYTLTNPNPSSWAHLLGWPIFLQPEFILLLHQRHPGALCLLGHWCVPAYNAPAKWFVVGWPEELILDVARHLEGSDWRECMDWPLQMTVAPIGGHSIPQ